MRYQPLLIRFRGICAHLDLESDTEKKKKRTLLVRHRNGNSNIEHHVPYVECLADDILAITSELRMLQYSRPGTDGRFGRIDLKDRPDTITIIRIKDVTPGIVTEDLSYKENVPHFKNILTNEDDAVAATSLKSGIASVDVKFATAVFDMPKGTLVAGEPEAMKTRFDSGRLASEEDAKRFSRWSDLYVQVPEGEVVMELEQRSNGKTNDPPQTITFARTVRMITIGNEPERLIVGLIGNADAHVGHHHATGNGNATNGHGPIQPTGHFILYYDILQNRPNEMPMPVPSQLEGSGCPNNNIP